MKARGRHCRGQARNQVVRLEHERARAVPPGLLEAELEPTIRAPREAVLRDGWPRDVLAESLDASTVSTIDNLSCVDVDAAHFSDGLIGDVGSARARRGLLGQQQAKQRFAGTLASDGNPLRSGRVAAGKGGLIQAELRRLGAFELGVEAAAVRFQDLLNPRGGAVRHVGDVGMGRCVQLEERKRSMRVAVLVHVPAVEHQGVQVHIESESRVRALHRDQREQIQ